MIMNVTCHGLTLHYTVCTRPSLAHYGTMQIVSERLAAETLAVTVTVMRLAGCVNM